MVALSQLIDQHATGDPDATAAAVFDALRCPDKWRELFYGVVRDECRRRYRSTVREFEGQSMTDAPSGIASGSRTAYLAERFYNGTKYVEWGTATVEDHLNRITYLTMLRGGIDVTIARHEQAVAEITAAGVACLAEIEVAP